MRQARIIITAFLVLAPFAAQATVISGVITDWAESGPFQVIGDGANHVTAWWSINTTDRGWFYGSSFTGDSDVAFASGVSAITDITDASIFGFTGLSTGPHCDADCAANGVGDFLVWRNTGTGHYGVLRLDDIYIPAGGGVLDARLNATWWFQTDGSGDFSGRAVPEPGTLALLAIGIAGFGLARRRKKL